MAQLKNPNLQIPNGFTFYVSDTRWSPRPYSSLDSIADQVLAHRKGRPDLVAKHQWAMDKPTVLAEVTAYNVARCQQMGWTQYIEGGSEGSPPFPSATPRRSLRQKARNVGAGVETVVTWRSDGSPTVPQALADKRAAVCVECPLNGKGGFEAYFTVPVQAAIKKELEKKREMKLETPMDDKLGVCTACDCPLPLKVWMPLDNILKKMPQESQDALAENCWIRNRDQNPPPP